MATLVAAFFFPSKMAPSMTNNVCSVMGTYGVGILIKAPTEIKAAKSAQSIKLSVFFAPFFMDVPPIFKVSIVYDFVKLGTKK